LIKKFALLSSFLFIFSCAHIKIKPVLFLKENTGIYGKFFFKTKGFFSSAFFTLTPGGKILFTDEFGRDVFADEKILLFKDELLKILRGNFPDYLRKIKEKENRTILVFGKNRFFLKKIVFEKTAKNLEKIEIFFKKGYALIKVQEVLKYE